jgi:Fe-S oxidoreductase
MECYGLIYSIIKNKNTRLLKGAGMFDESKCNRCGDCLVRCQYMDYDRERAIREFTALIEGRDSEVLTECTTCMACNEYCEQGAEPFELILKLQEERSIIPALESTLQNMFKQETVPSQIIKGDPDKPALSLCVMKTRLPEGSYQGRLFDGLTTVDGGEYFCYMAFLHAARGSYLAQNIQRFVDSLASLNAKEVVLIHDDCYSAITSKAREYGIHVPFKPIHIIEYLRNYIRENKGSVIKLNKNIAYQRPCISRYTSEKEPMLDELFELIGVTRVPRKYDRQDALCCGGIFMGKDREKGLKFQDRNITDAKAYNADAMVILCPVCWNHLSEPCRERGLLPIYLTNLCRMALGEIPFPS